MSAICLIHLVRWKSLCFEKKQIVWWFWLKHFVSRTPLAQQTCRWRWTIDPCPPDFTADLIDWKSTHVVWILVFVISVFPFERFISRTRFFSWLKRHSVARYGTSSTTSMYVYVDKTFSGHIFSTGVSRCYTEGWIWVVHLTMVFWKD